MFAPFRFQTTRHEQSQSLVGEFSADSTSVVIAAEMLDDSTTLLLCRSTKLRRDDDERDHVIRRVDRCRAARLVRITFDESHVAG